MRGRAAALGAALCVLVMSAACGDDGQEAREPTDTVAPTDDARELPTLEPNETIEVGEAPQNPAVGLGSVWVPNHHAASISRIDPATNEVVATIKTAKQSGGVGFGFGAAWVATYGARVLTRIDGRTNVPTQIDVPGLGCAWPVAAGDAVWACAGGPPARIVRVDPKTRSVERFSGAVGFPAEGFGSVWFADDTAGLISRVDPASGEVLGKVPVENVEIPVAGTDALWVGTTGLDLTLVRVDPKTMSSVELVPQGDARFLDFPHVGIDGDNVWVYDSYQTIFRVDQETNELIAVGKVPRPTGAAPTTFTAGFGALWVADFNRNIVMRFDIADLPTR